MRNAFADEVTQLAKTNSKIMLLSGDIGNKLFDNFKKIDPLRFINCGIAEANMISVASGLAINGLRPIIYTITPFVTARCFEQIRIDICYHEAPVVIVGTGAGLSYAELGPTHHSLEDLAIMRTLPGMRVFAPCDTTELRFGLHEAIRSNQPTYIRIGKKGEPKIHEDNISLEIGKAIPLRSGKDVLILSTGTIISNVLQAANLLNKNGISTQVTSFHTIKPFDKEYLIKNLHPYKLIVTVEEHGKIGGLGGAVAEILSGHQAHPKHLILGSYDEFMHEMGDQKYAQQKFNLDPVGIFNQIVNHYP